MRVAVSALAVAGIAGAASAQSLWFTAAETNQIWQANADGSGAPSVLYNNAGDDTFGPTGIDINPLTGNLFWGTGNNIDFWSGNANGSGAGLFANPVTGFAEALGTAVDPVAGRVYLLSNRTNGGLAFANTDGTGVTQTAFAPGGTVGVEWDGANNRVLVAQVSGGVWAVSPDGSSSSLIAPASDTRDVASNGSSIFWVDLTNVWMADADGSNAMIIADSVDAGNIRSVDALGDTLYMGEFDGNNGDTVWSIDLATGAETILHQGDFGGIRGVTVIPAPGAFALLGLGGLAAARRRR